MMSANRICSSSSTFLNLISKRSLASQATNPKPILTDNASQGALVSKAGSGLTVVSLENYAPVSKIALYVNAGSRYETNENLGINHALRTMAGLASKNTSAFGLTRNLQQIGANLQVTSTREHLVYTLDCLRDNLDVGVQFMSELALRPLFKIWEVQDKAPQIKLDLAFRDQCPETVLLDLLHKAAFRNGLGNSLYCPDHMIGNHSPEMLTSFANNHFQSGNMKLVGLGVDHERLTGFANTVVLASSGAEVAPPTSGYHGGEMRAEQCGELAYAAVATEGASLKNRKEMLCLAILQQILGTGPHIKWATSDASRLSKAAGKVTENPFAVSSINTNYSDSGLFGFCVAAQASEMNKVMKAIVTEMSGITKQGLTDQEIKQAKKRLRASVGLGLESSENLIEELAHDESSLSINDVNSAIENLTVSDIVTVAKKVITGKPSMAAVGNLSDTPYLDQL